MRFTEKLAIIFVRPLYRTFFERPVWWFLARVKAYFFAETGAQLSNIERQLTDIHVQLAKEYQPERWAALEERLRTAEASNAAQWDAMEQLLLALFRQPQVQRTEPVIMHAQNTAEMYQAHAASNIR